MNTFLGTFKLSIIQLFEKIANNSFFCVEKLPKHRIQSQLLFKSFNRFSLSECLLSSDLLFTVRQALAAGEVSRTIDYQKVSDLVLYLVENLTTLRPDYATPIIGTEKKISEMLKFWHQDTGFFGFANAETKFLFRDFVMMISHEENCPEYFESYKNLVMGIYGSIIRLNPEIKNHEFRLGELEYQLNRQFCKNFYNNLLSTVVHSKITSKEDAKKKLQILSIEPFQEIRVTLTLLYESRISSEEVVPCMNTSEIPKGSKAKIVDHSKITIPVGSIFEPHQFDTVIPESRRSSLCPNCKGNQQLVCHECLGKKTLKCNECNAGKLKCVRCKGTGEEEYSDSYEKMLPCSCDRGVVAQKNGFNAVMNALTRNDPNIPVFKEVTVSKCNLCKGMGFIQKTMERIKSRPCAYCSTRGVIVCQFCEGSTRVPCSCCGASGMVDCDGCDSIGYVEFRQIIHVKRDAVVSQTKFTAVPKECELKTDGKNFYHFATLRGNDLSERILKHSFDRRLSDSFKKAISNFILAESQPLLEGNNIDKELKILSSYMYRIRYQLNGVTAFSWWNPKVKADSISIKEYISGILDAALGNFKSKRNFEAAKQIVLAENLSKIDPSCTDVYLKFYKKLSIYKRFLVYVARHFVNPESIW